MKEEAKTVTIGYQNPGADDSSSARSILAAAATAERESTNE